MPRLLVIDDLFGRSVQHGRNEERANLCGQYLLKDVTGDQQGDNQAPVIKEPIAEAVFVRGQRPKRAGVGDVVENDLGETLEIVRAGWEVTRIHSRRWAMILLDLCFYTGRVTLESHKSLSGMPEGRVNDEEPEKYFGIQVLREIHDKFPEIPVLILSAKPRGEVSREFSKYGAIGFLPRFKSNSAELLRDFLWRHGLITDHTGRIIGESKSLLLALRSARRTAMLNRNILLRGERGSGKELLARYIHDEGARSTGPFVVVNSPVLTPELFPSELFGIGSRVATGVAPRSGLINDANGGDLFLDEIKDMPASVQAGVLRVLEERAVTPVGSSRSLPVEVRFLSATNGDVESLAGRGGFRYDLLDRLREGGTVVLPALRDRNEDIPLLVEHFVREAEHAHPSAVEREIDRGSLEKLESHDWPGNIRELRTCLFTAVSEYPDVEYLMPDHVVLPDTGMEIGYDQDIGSASTDITGDIAKKSDKPVGAVRQMLESLSFDAARAHELSDALPNLQAAYGRAAARCLRRALELTRRPEPVNPEGRIQIHPALKLLMGDADLSASKAADIVKRLRAISPEAEELWRDDPLLRAAYETATKLRPSRPRGSRKKKAATNRSQGNRG